MAWLDTEFIFHLAALLHGKKPSWVSNAPEQEESDDEEEEEADKGKGKGKGKGKKGSGKDSGKDEKDKGRSLYKLAPGAVSKKKVRNLHLWSEADIPKKVKGL